MSRKYSYTQIAENVELWREYVDPDATMTDEDFNSMSTIQKVAMQAQIFGDDNWTSADYTPIPGERKVHGRAKGEK